MQAKIISLSDNQKIGVRLRYERYVVKGSGCWSWTGPMTNGYGCFTWWDRDAKKRGNMKAHRASYMLAIGPIPAGLDVMHMCNNRTCTNPEHLSVGTRRENMAMSTTVGRRIRKIPLEDIPLIRKRREAGDSFYKIGRTYGCNHSCVRQMLLRNPG